jgi:hypothetical protein
MGLRKKYRKTTPIITMAVMRPMNTMQGTAAILSTIQAAFSIPRTSVFRGRSSPIDSVSYFA